jgi:prepilin-type N-terminal cleavage/methylation domain-containing protein
VIFIMKKIQNIISQKGFTLIELIIYMGLLSIFVTGAVMFSIDVMSSRGKAEASNAVEQNARVILQRIRYEIQNASSINSVSASQISLTTANAATNPTIISYANGGVTIQQGSTTPIKLSSNQIRISSMIFSTVSSADNNSKNIQINLTVNQQTPNASQSYSASTTMNTTVELRSNFNESRKLLIDATAASLANSARNIEGIKLENTGSSAVTIDKMSVSWIGGASGSQLQTIIINGSNVWNGTAASNSINDITNVAVAANSSAIPLTRLIFSGAMDGSTVLINFILSDGSSQNIELNFLAATPTPTIIILTPTPSLTPIIVVPTLTPTLTPTLIIPTNTPTRTPTPIPPTATRTPTPTPTRTPTPANCTQYCQQNYVVPGTCRKPNLCSGINAGKIFNCVGSDICCCQ